LISVSSVASALVGFLSVWFNWVVKKTSAKLAAKAGAVAGRKSGDRKGAIRRGEAHTTRVAEEAAQPGSIAYDAEDIEEANRFGAALCRQHAR
jgi:hypothetical protein